MVIIKIQENSTAVGEQKIRHFFDPEQKKWYFSVVDVIGILTKSLDARNYWKVLKSRLKSTHPELVTKCNQLKLVSRDGKYYLTDTADSMTMLEIIEQVPKASVQALKLLISDIEGNTLGGMVMEQHIQTEERAFGLSTTGPDDDLTAKLLVDAYRTPSGIIIEAMVAGTSLDDMSIAIAPRKVTIRGLRKNPEIIAAEKYVYQELYWTSFARSIDLPSPVDADTAEIKEENGRLKILLHPPR